MVNPDASTDPLAQISQVDAGDAFRLALMISGSGKGAFQDQALGALNSVEAALEAHSCDMRVTTQTVFLRNPSDEPAFRELMHARFGAELPVTTFVHQPPCNGAALALEAWAIGGAVRMERFGRHSIALSYDRVRWVYCGDITVPEHPEGVYAQSGIAMRRLQDELAEADSDLKHAVRTWFYLGGVTEPEGATQRYKELNRGRADFYEKIQFHGAILEPDPPQGIYPASTGIGMEGRFLTAACLTIQTERRDVRLLALENPQQTPAYAYHTRYSPKSPKFSRAMALVLGDYVTTWVSGTASIVNSESRHPNDPIAQTEQTIDNIERLISPDNFKFHSVGNGGSQLSDLAKIRVYVKRAQDYEAVREICDRRFGSVPAVYVVADICRPELLVEIEGVAFSRLR